MQWRSLSFFTYLTKAGGGRTFGSRPTESKLQRFESDSFAGAALKPTKSDHIWKYFGLKKSVSNKKNVQCFSALMKAKKIAMGSSPKNKVSKRMWKQHTHTHWRMEKKKSQKRSREEPTQKFVRSVISKIAFSSFPPSPPFLSLSRRMSNNQKMFKNLSRHQQRPESGRNCVCSSRIEGENSSGRTGDFSSISIYLAMWTCSVVIKLKTSLFLPNYIIISAEKTEIYCSLARLPINFGMLKCRDLNR